MQFEGLENVILSTQVCNFYPTKKADSEKHAGILNDHKCLLFLKKETKPQPNQFSMQRGFVVNAKEHVQNFMHDKVLNIRKLKRCIKYKMKPLIKFILNSCQQKSLFISITYILYFIYKYPS